MFRTSSEQFMGERLKAAGRPPGGWRSAGSGAMNRRSLPIAHLFPNTISFSAFLRKFNSCKVIATDDEPTIATFDMALKCDDRYYIVTLIINYDNLWKSRVKIYEANKKIINAVFNRYYGYRVLGDYVDILFAKLLSYYEKYGTKPEYADNLLTLDM